MPSSLRSSFAIVAALLLALPVFPFQSPLSDEAVRDAYFLGQRNDKSTADFFSSYLPPTARSSSIALDASSNRPRTARQCRAPTTTVIFAPASPNKTSGSNR